MADDVERNVLLKLKLLADDSNKAAADSVRSEVESLVEDMAAGYALVRESAINEADKAAAGQVSAARKAAKDIQDAMAAAGKAIASPGTKLQGATVVSPGKGVTATGTATVSGGAGNAAAKQAQKDAEAAEKAYDKEAAAAVKAYSRIMREREKNAADAAKKSAKAQADAEKAFDQEAQAAAKAYSRIMREREKLQNTAAAQAEAHKQLQGQAVKSAAEGLGAVVKIGRGFAEIGILSEETTEGMLRGLIKVQAGFDIITGGIDSYIKITEAIRNATKALQAQAAAQAAVNALNAAGGRAAATNAAGQAASSAAGNAGKILGAAGTVAAGGGGLVALGGALGSLASGAGALVAKFVLLPAILAEVIQWFRRMLGFDAESIIGATVSLWNERKKAAESEKNTAKKEKDRENRQDDTKRRNEGAKEADELARNLASWNERLAAASRDASGLDGPKKDNAERADVLAAMEAAKGTVAAERAKRDEAKAQFKGDARAGEDLAQTRLIEETEKLLSIDQRRAQSLREQAKTQQDQVKNLRDQLAQADKLVAQEKAQYQSTLARLGALTKAEQMRAAEIAKKSAAGQQINEGDARFLQSVGIGGKKADEFFANKAAGLGGDATLAGLGEGTDKIQEAETARQEVAKQLADAEAGLSETTNALDKAMEELKNTIAALAATVNAKLAFDNEANGRSDQPAPTVNVPGSGPGNQVADASNKQADEIRQMGDAAAESQKQMSEAFLAALDKIESENAAAIDALKSRQTRGALNAASGDFA